MNSQKKHGGIYRVLLSALAGFTAAYALIVNMYQNDLRSNFDWAVTLSLLTFGFGIFFFLLLPRLWEPFLASVLPVRIWLLTLVLISATCFALSANFAFGVTLIFLFFLCSTLIAVGFASFNKLLEQERSIRFIFAWLLGGFFSFFATGLLGNFYPSLWEFVLVAISLNILVTLAWEIILEYASSFQKEVWKEKIILVSVLGLGLAFIVLMARLLSVYKDILPLDFLPAPKFIPVFLGLAVLSQSWTALIADQLDRLNWRTSRFVDWTGRNLPGLLLASAITISTFSLALPFVSTDLGRVDNYFDTDSVNWIHRLTAPVEDLDRLRSVHPFILLILRPPVWLLSLLLNGNKVYAAVLLNSMVGGLCVYLMWLFFKQRTRNTAYALLIAALLGFSNSHLILSAFLETYIFSAATLIAFVFLLQSEDRSFRSIVPVGLLTFGITITNFIQTCILYLFTPPRTRTFLKYIVTVLAIAILVTFVQDLIYPASEPFFIPSNFTRENAYRFNVFEAAPRLIISRANLMFRHITLFDIVAPRPLILLNEVGCSFPCLQTYYKHQGVYAISSYAGFGSLLARTWFVLLALAAGVYLWRLFRTPRETSLQNALVLTLLFNFTLHMLYGDDPILYSPDWTYAVVFFFGISYERFSGNKWFQGILLIFLAGLSINNLDLFRRTLEAVAPFLR